LGWSEPEGRGTTREWIRRGGEKWWNKNKKEGGRKKGGRK